MTAVVVVLAVCAIALAGVCWVARVGPRVQSGLVAAMAVSLGIGAVLAVVGGQPGGDGGGARGLLVLFAVLAVVGGGPLAVEVLRLADGRVQARQEPPGAAQPEALDEGEVLRGGAWIGSLERAGIFATLAVGWPEGVAVVLAVKGVGRYQELRGSPGASERFIIGTFASVLWAAACAGVWWFG